MFATQISLSIFTNLFHQRFEKYSMLESTLEILQQFYIQMKTQPDDFHLFAGDLSTYTLRCIRCGQSVTLPGSIGETLLHAPTAMLYHWNMIQSHDEENHRESMLMPLLFTSYDIYLRSSKSFEEDLNWSEDLTIHQKPNMDKLYFVRLLRLIWQIPKRHHSRRQKTISSTLSLITVLVEDLFEAVTFHRDFGGEKVDPKPSISLLNKTNTCDGYDFNIGFITDEVNALQKELLMLFEMLFEGFVSLVTGNSTKNCFVF